MKEGQVVKVLARHRNLGDDVRDSTAPGRAYTPTYFYRRGVALIKKTASSDRDMRVLWKTAIFGEPDVWEEITLDVLTDGYFTSPPMHRLKPSTVIGVRGPFIAWSHIKVMPPTFWLNE